MDARRPASFQLKKWGLVHGWLVGGMGRQVLLEATIEGMQVQVIDGGRARVTETIGPDEDPSGAAWRAITKMAKGER